MSSSSSDNHQLSVLVELSAALVSRRRRAWHHLGNPKTRLALFLALSLRRLFLSLSLSLASSLTFFGSFLLPRRIGYGVALVPDFDLARTENYLILETLKLASPSSLLLLLLSFEVSCFFGVLGLVLLVPAFDLARTENCWRVVLIRGFFFPSPCDGNGNEEGACRATTLDDGWSGEIVRARGLWSFCCNSISIFPCFAIFLSFYISILLHTNPFTGFRGFTRAL